MHIRNNFFNIILVTVIFINCTGNGKIDEQTAVVCMDRKITIADFRIMYELDPAFPSYKRGSEGLQEYAEKTAAKILAAKSAEAEGVFEKLSAKNAIEYRRKNAVVRSFYKEEIADEIEVSDEEMRSAFLGMSARVRLKQIFSSKEEDARYFYNSLEKGIPFDTLAAQVFKELGKQPAADLGLVSWGELDESLEKTAWSMKPGEYSQPVQSKWGYHILFVIARHELFVPSSDEFVRRSQSVYKKVKRKKEEKAANAYLKEYLTPYDIKVKRGAFLKLAGALKIDVETGKLSAKSLLRDQSLTGITDAQIVQIEELLKDDLSAFFMTSKKENWTIQQFLDKVKKIPIYKRPKINSLKQLKDDIGIVIRNDFLYNQAVKEGHAESTFVDSVVTVFKQETAYQHYLRQYFFAMEVPQNTAEYFAGIAKNRNITVSKPAAVLDGMQELRQFKAYYSEQKLHKDLFEKYSQEKIIFNTAFIKEEAKRINWDNPVRIFVPENL